MRVVAPNTDGVFTFKAEEAGREVIFVKSVAIVADIEAGHCSNHSSHSSGCDDCTTAALFTTVNSQGLNIKGVEEALATNKQEFEAAYTRAIKIRKRAALKIEISKPDAKLQMIQQQLSRVFAVFFAGAKDDAAKAAIKKVKALLKSEVRNDEEIILAAYLAIEWAKLFDAVRLDLFGAFQSGAETALVELGLVTQDARKAALEAADEYAMNRAAEMIGKKYVNNKLVDNTSATFVISDSTKDDLSDIVHQAIKHDLTIDDLEQHIKYAATFSDMRAKFIAKNEVAMAQVQGNLNVWKSSGAVKQVIIVLNPRHTVLDECDSLAAGSPYDINKVPLIPSHPNCECAIIAVE